MNTHNTLTLSQDVLAGLDHIAALRQCTRAEAVAYLVEVADKRHPKPRREPTPQDIKDIALLEKIAARRASNNTP